MMISLDFYSINLRTLLRGRGGGAHGHALVLALAHLHVSKGATGCLRPSARPEGSFSLISLNGFRLLNSFSN